tara:strand:- start:820 stop:1857 length:1038 start_codon:yes stop_codon:yes gene_type:complete
MIVNNFELGEFNKPYIIAELSANHGGSISRAKKSISEAAKCGVSAVKIQTYTPDTMTIKCDKQDFYVSDGLWSGRQLYDLYEEAYTPFEWHKELFEHAKEVGITLFSTPFDETAVDLLESLNTPAYKIASFEIIDLPLLEYVSSKQKPIFLSTGMASKDEIQEAVNTIRKINDNEILLFHCISSYPTPTEKSHLRNIHYLREKFGVKVGLSDHTFSNLAAIVAIGMGAVAIEKHFKLDQEDCGPDSSFSLDVSQLSELVNDCNMAWSAKGKTSFRRADIEKENKVFRRSLYFINNLKKGDKIKESDIRRIRPGYGLSPKHYDEIIGKKLTKSVEKGDPVSWDDFS